MVNVKTAILTLIFLATLIILIVATPWGDNVNYPYSFELKEGLRMPESGIGDIGMAIFTTYLFPFEVLALVLLAALIGAIYVARKEIAR
jgi:NADH-ubiquinone/plastoquinone oxidoreductase chain 6.